MNALLGVFVPKRSTSSSLKDCLIVFVDRSSAVGVHLQPHVADRDKDEVVLAVRCNRVGGLTRRWRIGIDLTNNQCGHQIVVIRIEDGYADALKSSEVHALLSGVEPDLVPAHSSDRRQNIPARDANHVTAAGHYSLLGNQHQPGGIAGGREDSGYNLSSWIDFV